MSSSYIKSALGDRVVIKRQYIFTILPVRNTNAVWQSRKTYQLMLLKDTVILVCYDRN